MDIKKQKNNKLLRPQKYSPDKYFNGDGQINSILAEVTSDDIKNKKLKDKDSK